MRKLFILSTGLCLLSLSVIGCGNKEKGQLNDAAIDGSWVGLGNALGYDEDYSIDSLNMEITENGVLTMDDNDQDTNDLSAAIFVEEEGKLTMRIYNDPSKLNLPYGWTDMQEENTLSYDIPSENTLSLTYKDITYFFKKDSSLSGSQSSPLYSLGENNVWYSNDGSKQNETSYELDLYNDYAELYSVSPNNAKALLTNFYCLSNQGDSFTFYTCIPAVKDMPEVLSSAPQGLGTIDLKLSCQDEALTMTYQDQTLVFYNNVIYGLKTGGDSYSLCDKYFSVKEGEETYYCHFAMNKNDTLYLYISDKEDENDPAIQTVCGEIAMDEKNNCWIWYIDKKESAECKKKNPVLYSTYSALNGLKVEYKLEASRLHLKTAEKEYDLDLLDKPDQEGAGND